MRNQPNWGNDFIFGRLPMQIKPRMRAEDPHGSWGFFPRVLVASTDGDDVTVSGAPQRRGRMLAFFSPLYLSQRNRGQLEGTGRFDTTLHLSHACKPRPPPPSLFSPPRTTTTTTHLSLSGSALASSLLRPLLLLPSPASAFAPRPSLPPFVPPFNPSLPLSPEDV